MFKIHNTPCTVVSRRNVLNFPQSQNLPFPYGSGPHLWALMSPLSDGRERAGSQQEIPFGYDLHVRLHQVVGNVPSRQVLKDVGSVLLSLLLHGNRAQKTDNSQRDPRPRLDPHHPPPRPGQFCHQHLSLTYAKPKLSPEKYSGYLDGILQSTRIVKQQHYKLPSEFFCMWALY